MIQLQYKSLSGGVLVKISGIIAEYNPFHNGHLHHIKETKRNTGADAIVCVMSGNFVQRGAPAVFDKWTRTSHALKNGVDLVIELPLEFSMASAERFAYGGVYLLNAINADYISFGAESSKEEIINAYEKIKKIDLSELKSTLKEGVSFATARQHIADTDVLESPNNILALEYLKAIEKTNSKIVPNFVKRCTSDYNSNILDGISASAKAIRNAVNENKDISDFVPGNTLYAYDNFIGIV